MATDSFSDMDGYEDDVGLDTEDKKHARGNQQEWFKGEKGVTYRTSLVYFHSLDVAVAQAAKKKAVRDGTKVTPEQLTEFANKALAKRAEELGKAVDQLQAHEKLDLSNARFKKLMAHYKEGVGYALSRLGKEGAESDEIWKMLGEPKKYFTTLLLIYPTNREGEPIKEQLAHSWTLKPWRFGNKVYGRFHEVAESLRANDLTIVNQDLSLKCTNTEFQNFEVDGAGKAIWRKDPRFMAKVLEKAMPFYDKLVPFRELSTADLRIKLGLPSGSSVADDVGTDEYSSILDGV